MADAPVKAPTPAELAAKALAVQLRAQIDALQKCQPDATPGMSHSGQAILRLEGKQRNNLLGRLRSTEKATSHFIPTFLARLRKVNVRAYAPMTTGATSSLNAFGRATEEHLDMLLGTKQLDGEGTIERGAGGDDPSLLGQVTNGILAGLQTMQPALYQRTIDYCEDKASTVDCIQQLLCDDPMSPSYYVMG